MLKIMRLHLQRTGVALAFVLLAAIFLLAGASQTYAAIPPPVYISVGKAPIAIAINEQTDKIYTVNTNDNSVTVIEGTTNSVVATIRVGNSPSAIALDRDRNMIYVANEKSVSVIDGATNTVETTITVSENPARLAFDVTTRILYVGHRNVVTLIDGAANSVIQTVSISGTTTAIAVNEDTNKAYIATSNGEVTIIGDGYETTTLNMDNRPDAIGVNKTANKIYVSTDSSLKVIDGVTDTVTATIDTGHDSISIAINEKTDTIYLPNRGNASLTVIDGETNNATRVDLETGSGPFAAVVDPGTNQIFVAHNSGNMMSIIDGDSLEVSSLFAGNYRQVAIAVNPTSHKVYLLQSNWVTINQVVVFYPMEDTTPPTVTFEPNGSTVPAQSASSVVTVTDAESGVEWALSAWSNNPSVAPPSSAYWSFANGDEVRLTQNQPNGLYYLYIRTQDKAGNSTIVRSSPFLLDNLAPTVTITGYNGASAVDGTINRPFTAAFTFSEPVDGFGADHIELDNASISDFVQVDAQNYTALVTPTTSGQSVTIRIAAGAVTDEAGNGNLASNMFSVLYDLAKPTVAITGFSDNQIIGSPLSAFSVTVSEAVYLIDGSVPISEEDASLLFRMEKDGLPFAEYTTSYDDQTLTYRILFDRQLEDGVYMVYITGDVVQNLSGNTLDAVNVGFTIAIPAVTGLTAGLTDLPSTGGNLNAVILGRNLIDQSVEIYVDGVRAAIANMIDAGHAEATVLIPANTTNSDKIHRLTVWLNGVEISDLVATVSVRAELIEEPPPPPPPSPRPSRPSPASGKETVLQIDKNGESVDMDTFDPSQPFVEIDLSSVDESSIYVGIPSVVLEEWRKQNDDFVVRILSAYGEYWLPVDLVSLIPELPDWLQENGLQLDDIAFRIKLTDLTEDTAIHAAFKESMPNGDLLGPIVDFVIEIVNVRTGEPIGSASPFSEFSVRIDRLLPMSDKPTLWGAFRYNEAGFEFVPAVLERKGDVWFARIRSNTNSIYVVADNQVHFTDTLNHWGRLYVEQAHAKGLARVFTDRISR